MSLTTTLERPTLGDPCGPQCPDVTDCPFCEESVGCEHRPREDVQETCRGSAHEECHRLECRRPECWTDPDAAWDSRDE